MNNLKSAFVTSLFLCLCSPTFAQEEAKKIEFLIKPTIGLLTSDNLLHGRLFAPTGSTHHLPRLCYGTQFEVKFSHFFGLAIEANYSKLSHSWVHNSNSGFAPFGYEEPNVADNHTDTVQKMRLLIRMNWYNQIAKNSFTYITFGIGVNYITRDESATGHKLESTHYQALLPTARFAIGFKHYFTNWLGVNTEIGLGGGTPLNLGIIFRL